MAKSGSSTMILLALTMALCACECFSETLYVDGRAGDDNNPGTQDKPFGTLARAAVVVNGRKETGPVTIKIGSATYALRRCVVFEDVRPAAETDRLVIEASVLPGDVRWTPALMPVVLSIEDPGGSGGLTETYSIKVKRNHVTIRGLRFLGNPLMNNWHACIERRGKECDDLLITQCMFVGSPDTLNIYCAAIATGDRFIVDHCIFDNCHAAAVFWDGPEGIGGRQCAMRYSIVNGSYISGVWTCRTAEDFEFHHNIITGCDYFWMRKQDDKMTYKVRDCIVVNNNHYSGYGVESGAGGQTGPDVKYDESNVVKSGRILIEKNKGIDNYLHVMSGTSGSELGAGLK